MIVLNNLITSMYIRIKLRATSLAEFKSLDKTVYEKKLQINFRGYPLFSAEVFFAAAINAGHLSLYVCTTTGQSY